MAPAEDALPSITPSEKSERPVAVQGDLRNLPKALSSIMAIPNWVCWRWELKVNRQGVGCWTKPPVQPHPPYRYARNNDASTWGTYEEALSAFIAGQCDGIGFNLFGTEVAAFDIDNCRDPETGVIAPAALALVHRSGSYTEITVSGTGLRIIGRGCGEELHRKQKVRNTLVEVESYRKAKRYIVITGHSLKGAPTDLADIDGVMNAVAQELDGDQVSSGFDFKRAGPQSQDYKTEDLPADLIRLVEHGVALSQDLSAAFHRAVRWLASCGMSVNGIERYVRNKPIMPARYSTRLRAEIERCLSKPTSRVDDPRSQPDDQRFTKTNSIEVFWHGAAADRPARSWLVENLIPQTGHGLAAGQWGAAKTFTVLDLSASVATATPFAGRPVSRRGGTLFVAAEGSSEIPVRLQAAIDHKLRPLALSKGALGEPINVDLGNLPFAWVEECPPLQPEGGFAQLSLLVRQVAQTLHDRFDVPLALIIIDTLNAAAGFKDANDAAEGQIVMNRLGQLSRMTGAFVLAVDHFGKAVETGTRGTSAKEAAADVVLAMLADRDTAGNISNTRMAVRKLRAGATGMETPFSLQVVETTDGGTTCIVEWKPANEKHGRVADTSRKERWTQSLRILKSAMTTALIEHGMEEKPFGAEGPRVRCVSEKQARREYIARYPGEAEAKQKAFKRALSTAMGRELIASREIRGIDHLWFTADLHTTDIHADRPDTT